MFDTCWINLKTIFKKPYFRSMSFNFEREKTSLGVILSIIEAFG